MDRLSRLLERMTKGSVADVVQERREDSHPRPLLVEAAPHLSSDNLYQAPSIVKNAHGMRKAAVSRCRTHELGDAELLDSPQPLEVGRLEQLPRGRVGFFPRIESHETVDGISDPFGL